MRNISLAISEVWIYKANKLYIYHFANSGYVKTDASLIFPKRNLKEIVTQYVTRAWQVGSSVALRELEQAL